MKNIPTEPKVLFGALFDPGSASKVEPTQRRLGGFCIDEFVFVPAAVLDADRGSTPTPIRNLGVWWDA